MYARESNHMYSQVDMWNDVAFCRNDEQHPW